VRAGELDCPQDNQALQASTDFRIETGLSIFFIQCCKLGFFSSLVFIRCDCQSDNFLDLQKFVLKIPFWVVNPISSVRFSPMQKVIN